MLVGLQENREQIAQRVIGAIKSMMENKNIRVSTESKLLNDLQMDSLAAIMLMNDLEDEFRIKIADGEFDSLKTVRDVVNLVSKRVADTPQQAIPAGKVGGGSVSSVGGGTAAVGVGAPGVTGQSSSKLSKLRKNVLDDLDDDESSKSKSISDGEEDVFEDDTYARNRPDEKDDELDVDGDDDLDFDAVERNNV
ncbi:MAG: acyl carrier protein [Oligoflexia bacterium]|nr:acyl carrier protein [Oligoflexia bacterium]